MANEAAYRYRDKIKADPVKSSEYKSRERQRNKHYNEHH